LGRITGEGDVIAAAIGGKAALFGALDGHVIPTVVSYASGISAVALGRIADEDVLVTGSLAGALVVWGLQSGSRMALTLDKPIERVWVIHGSDRVAAKADGFFVLKVVGRAGFGAEALTR
jgi:hypothetical protein